MQTPALPTPCYGNLHRVLSEHHHISMETSVGPVGWWRVVLRNQSGVQIVCGAAPELDDAMRQIEAWCSTAPDWTLAP